MYAAGARVHDVGRHWAHTLCEAAPVVANDPPAQASQALVQLRQTIASVVDDHVPGAQGVQPRMGSTYEPAVQTENEDFLVVFINNKIK